MPSTEGTRRYEAALTACERVAIVGPAPHLIGQGCGKEIDTHDLVVRVNQGNVLTSNAADFGTRTDLIYTDYNSTFRRYVPKANLPEDVIIVSTRDGVRHPDSIADARFQVTRETEHLNTGVRACLDAIAFANLRRISVYGFSFYVGTEKYAVPESEYLNMRLAKGLTTEIHRQAPNVRAFRQFAKDPRVCLHPLTREALKQKQQCFPEKADESSKRKM